MTEAALLSAGVAAEAVPFDDSWWVTVTVVSFRWDPYIGARARRRAAVLCLDESAFAAAPAAIPTGALLRACCCTANMLLEDSSTSVYGARTNKHAPPITNTLRAGSSVAVKINRPLLSLDGCCSSLHLRLLSPFYSKHQQLSCPVPAGDTDTGKAISSNYFAPVVPFAVEYSSSSRKD